MINDIMLNWSKYPQLRYQMSFKILMELDLNELEEIIETQKLNIRMEEAATYIQQQYRAWFIKKEANEL